MPVPSDGCPLVHCPGPRPPFRTRGAAERTCDTNVESTVGVTASPTVAVFILFMATNLLTAPARAGQAELPGIVTV